MKYQYFIASRWRNKNQLFELAESLYLIFDEYYPTIDDFIESLK